MKLNFTLCKIYSLVFLIILFIFRIILYLINGENSYITIHDNLDSVFTWHKVISDNKLIFSIVQNPEIKEIMNGSLKRNHLTPPFNIAALILYNFPGFWGYLINMIIAYITGYVGMYLLLIKHIFKQNFFQFNYYDKVSILISAAFIYFDIYVIYGGGYILCIPLLIHAFINLLRKEKLILNYFIILFCGFYTSFPLTGFFTIVILFAFLFYFYYKNRAFNRIFLIGVLLYTFAVCIAEINVFLSFIDKDFISHRVEFTHDTEKQNLLNIIKLFIFTLLNGHYHAPAFSLVTIFLFFIITFNQTDENKIISIHNILFLFIIFSILFFSIWHWKNFTDIKLKIGLLKVFNLSRLMFVSTALWLILLALIIKKQNFIKKNIILFLLIIQLYFIAYNNFEYRNNLYLIVKNSTNRKFLTFKEYFSENLFRQIKDTIKNDVKKYTVASLGLHPNIALYNGFKVIDSYQANYPLKYKKQFRKIIEPELNKNEELKKYFDGWGSRCYLFSAELGKNFLIYNQNISIKNLELNKEALKTFNCKYLISAVEIKKINNTNTDNYLLKIFTHKDSKYKIYLYKFT